MTKPDEKRKSGWMLAAVGALLCLGVVSCKSIDVPAIEEKPVGVELSIRKPVEPSEPLAAQKVYPGAGQSNAGAIQHYNRGNALREQGKFAEAEASYRRAVELDPKNADAHYNLGASLGAQGKWPEAVTASRQAVELAPKNADAHYNLGTALGGQHKFAEAEAPFRRAIELDPNLLKAHYNLGNVLSKQGKHAEATESFRRAGDLGTARP